MPTIKTYQDPKYPTNTVYISTSDFGKAMYMSGPKVFVVYDQRDNIICRLDYDIAVNIAAIFSQLTSTTDIEIERLNAELTKMKQALDLACDAVDGYPGAYAETQEGRIKYWLDQAEKEER